MKITKIEAQKKNPLRENIFLDHEFAFGISTELRFLSKLHVDDSLTKAQVEKLVRKDQVSRLVEKALKFLSYRPRSEKEIRDHLLFKGKLKEMDSDDEKKNYQGSVEAALNFLIKHKQIDDRQFSLWWIEGRRKFKKTSDQVIRSELFAKGISKALVDQLLKENVQDPFELAQDAARKKLVSYQNLEREAFRIKMGQYLLRRGFSWEVAARVVDTILKKE